MSVPCRIFLSQDALDEWVSVNGAELATDHLKMAGVGVFALTPAVLFETEVTEEGDPAKLIGRVKTLEGLAELEADHYADSVLLGDVAYQVVEGFVGDWVSTAAGDTPTDGPLAELAAQLPS